MSPGLVTLCRIIAVWTLPALLFLGQYLLLKSRMAADRASVLYLGFSILAVVASMIVTWTFITFVEALLPGSLGENAKYAVFAPLQLSLVFVPIFQVVLWARLGRRWWRQTRPNADPEILTISAALRRLLRMPDSCERVRADWQSGALRKLFGFELQEHVADVYARFERAADSSDDVWWVKLAVLVHEQDHDAVDGILERAGFADVSLPVRSLLRSFGRMWKISEGGDLAAFVDEQKGAIRPLLLFELAHEGSATATMNAVAKAAAIEPDLERWASRLLMAPSRP